MQVGFYEELITAKGIAFDELKAGFYALRSVEDALDDLPRDQAVRKARRAMRRVRRLPLRGYLRSLLAFAQPGRILSEDDRSDIVRSLLAFGIELHADGRYKAAIEVFDSIAQRFAADTSVRLSAIQRRAFASRMLKEFADAEFGYRQMLTIATAHHVVAMEMEAQLGLARVMIERGAPREAQPIVNGVLRRARRRDLIDIVAKALIDRSAIAGIRGDFYAVIFDAHEALDIVQQRGDREAILVNMGYAFREVGHTQPALEIGQHLAATAYNADVRAHGAVLALNSAIDIGDDPLIERLVGGMETHVLSPLPNAEFHEALARNHAMRGDFKAACASATEMRDIARQHRMFEVEHRAEKALDDIGRGVMPAVYAYRPAKKTAASERLAAVEESIRIRILCSA